ncbi:MAG: hypothetical protein NVSMB13_10060 [Mycobacteriales bacterium]
MTGVRFHDLRHFYASLLITGGESIKVVSDRLGHKDASTTLNIYAHLYPEADEQTRRIVDAAFQTSADQMRTAASARGADLGR